MEFLPSPIEIVRRGRRSYELRNRRRQPVWTRPWFWFTGAFSLAIVFWVVLGELWLAYAMLWGALWGLRWLLAMAFVGRTRAIESHREDRLHEQGFYEVAAR